MANNRTVQRRKGKKKGRPKVKFSFGMLFSIIIFSFAAVFVLYMLTANFNENFLSEEFGISANVPDSGESSEDTAKNKKNTDDTPNDENEDDGIANPVPQSAKADSSYLEDCCLVTDKTLAGFNGFGTSSVFGGETVNVSNVMTEKIESSFGTLSVYDIIKQKKPQTLYIMLGSELGTVSADDMTESYTNFVSSLKSALPNMTIYVMQYPPVLYDSDTLTNEAVNDYNNKLLMMCNTLGVYCIDTNTALKSGSGTLDEALWSYETLSLSQEGYDRITDYILTHTAR